MSSQRQRFGVMHNAPDYTSCRVVLRRNTAHRIGRMEGTFRHGKRTFDAFFKIFFYLFSGQLLDDEARKEQSGIGIDHIFA